MKIKEIIDDIVQDLDTIESRTEESRRDLRHRDNQTSGAYFQILIPNIIGFVVGLAIARLINMDFSGYIALGTLCALIGGVYKSVSYDKVSLKPAIVRNVLLMSPIVILCAIAAIRN